MSERDLDTANRIWMQPHLAIYGRTLTPAPEADNG
jgi:hypothetical protein